MLVDIDDTLVDFGSASRQGLANHLAEVAPHLDAPAAGTVWRELTELHYGRFQRGQLTFTEQRRLRVRDFCAYFDLPLGTDDAIVDAWFGRFNARLDAHLAAFPDVLAALATLAARGVPLGAVSNSDHANQSRKLDRLALRHRFKALVCCDDVGGAAKPDPRIFHHACRLLGSPPAVTVYLGDDLDKDARGAAAAGLVGVWLNRGGRPGPAGLPSVRSLTEFVDRLTEFRAAGPALHRTGAPNL